MAVGLTYSNTTGAIGGINQSGSGVTIPETFLRWAQDVLFDRNGLIRRRAPFTIYPLYDKITKLVSQPNTTNERTIASVSTVNPTGDRIIGLVNVTDSSSKIHFYDANARGPYTSPMTSGTILTSNSICDIKPASTAGVWLGFLDSYNSGSSTNDYTQYYWRGGCGLELTYSHNVTAGPTTYILNIPLNASNGSYGKIINLTSPIVTVTNATYTDTTVTLNVASHAFIVGQEITVAGITPAGYNGNYTISSTTSTSITYYNNTNAARVSGGTIINNYVPASGQFVYLVNSVGVEFYAGTIVSATPTSFTLEKDVIRPVVGVASATVWTGYSVKLYNIRPFTRSHSRGLISGNTGAGLTLLSGNLGTEAEGHWKSADIASWALYRAGDGQWLGDIATVSDNSTLVLSSVAGYFTSTTLTLKADEYTARPYLPVTAGNTISPVISTRVASSAGIFTATYNGVQWYGNAADAEGRNRIVFSSHIDSESVDLSNNDADSIIIPGLSEMRGLASSSSGLLIFMADKTFILRGNSRFNYSLEELYPEGCLSAMSIVEYGGGVFWASKTGIFLFDGSTVRNLSKDNLGLYYSQSLKEFNMSTDRVYAFFHKDYLFMHFTAWKSIYNPVRYEPIYADAIEGSDNAELAIKGFAADDWDPDFSIEDFTLDSNTPLYWDQKTMYYNGSGSSTNTVTGKWGPSSTSEPTPVWGSEASQLVWGPADLTESMTIAIYLPTNAITIFSNFGFRNAIKIDSVSGLKALIAVNIINPTGYASGVYSRFVDVDSIFNLTESYTTGIDEELIENNGIAFENYIKGPDLFIQTKHYTMGDPLLKKWFKQLFLNLYLIDGCLRLDFVDNEDNDFVDVRKKKHTNWELFTSISYTWDMLEKNVLPSKLSPNRSTWDNLEKYNVNWFTITSTQFERRKKKFSWRYPTFGFRLYQVNDYRPNKTTNTQRPYNAMIEAWDIGFKPMRASRV